MSRNHMNIYLDTTLEHAGVKGMKWGRRKARTTNGTSKRGKLRKNILKGAYATYKLGSRGKKVASGLNKTAKKAVKVTNKAEEAMQRAIKQGKSRDEVMAIYRKTLGRYGTRN